MTGELAKMLDLHRLQACSNVDGDIEIARTSVLGPLLDGVENEQILFVLSLRLTAPAE